jgi:transposase InsO family protein
VKRFKQLCRCDSRHILEVIRRHDRRPSQQRVLEHEVRSSVVQVVSDSAEHGYTLAETAALLNLQPRTVRGWRTDYRNHVLRVRVLGRPLLRASVAERNQVIDLLDELGPATGLPTLRDCFPALARAELADILKRYRRVWRKLHVEIQHRLRWPIPGRVWAIDFTYAPRPIDGLYPYLLAVRDLASGKQLLWLPVLDLGAGVVQNALASLFTCHGAPLVLKMDNGSAFLADLTQELLTCWQVIPLFSPPYFPRYNGSAEAGIGSLKTRTEAQAAHEGHPGHWTWHDTASAQAQANATARPRGPHGPTADRLWTERSTITMANVTPSRPPWHEDAWRSGTSPD